MEQVYFVKKDKRKIIPAVTHNDGTGRLQTVSKKLNPTYYRLIEEFEKKTGIPVILNTSFNVQGEPIVCTPTDALKTFYSSGIDVLIMGNCIIEKHSC
jgi:carbamoyltransferase